jgi:hydroxypyruvate isomerase
MAGAAAARLPLIAQTATPRKGRLKQSVTVGVFDPAMPFEDRCREAARLGIKGFDLAPPADWPVLKKYGLVPAMAPARPGLSIANGINDRSRHGELEPSMRSGIDECAAAGCPNLIVLSGNRRGMPDAQGADNAVAFLERIKAQAEDRGVTICLELLNSKIDHKDYMCDHTAWGVDVVRRTASPRVKLLYDIYHMQIMEGDVCRTIRENIQWIAHFHTGGVPGRHEIDGTQELNYRFIALTLADLGFTGYIAHEYRHSPDRDALQELNKAVEIMDV